MAFLISYRYYGLFHLNLDFLPLFSDMSGQEETPLKRKPNGKPPWSSSEVLAAVGRTGSDRLRLDQRAASESLEGTLNY